MDSSTSSISDLISPTASAMAPLPPPTVPDDDASPPPAASTESQRVDVPRRALERVQGPLVVRRVRPYGLGEPLGGVRVLPYLLGVPRERGPSTCSL